LEPISFEERENMYIIKLNKERKKGKLHPASEEEK
jgi:hypothetical protein